MNVVAIVVIVILIIVVLLIIVALMKSSKGSSRSPSSSSTAVTPTRSSSSSSPSSSSSESTPRMRHRVTMGKPVEEQPKVEASQFPRTMANAGNKMSEHKFLAKNGDAEETEVILEKEEIEAEEKKVPPMVETSGDNQSVRVVTVARMADLFRAQTNIEDELGLSPEELEKMVQSYKKKTEYRERRLPVNSHFTASDLKKTRQVQRESVRNGNSFTGSKRGNIVKETFKAHASNFTAQKPQTFGGVMSIMTDPEKHRAQMQKSIERRNPGHLVVNH